MSKFVLNLQICKEQDTVQVQEPAFINDKFVETVSTMIGYFLEQELENHNMEVNEEKFREYVVEVAYCKFWNFASENRIITWLIRPL